MLQQVEEQTSTADNAAGRLVTDTTWNSKGCGRRPRPSRTTTPRPARYERSFFATDPGQIPGQTVTTYDGQGRVTASAFYSLGVAQWQTTTSYPGMDETDTTPPSGGTATESRHELARRDDRSRSRTTRSAGNADTTSYTYTPLGQVASIADNNGNTWTYTYNLLGQKTTATDPGTTAGTGLDARPGTTSYSYDGDGNLTPSRPTRPDRADLHLRRPEPEDRRVQRHLRHPGDSWTSWTYDQTPLNGGTGTRSATASSSTSYDSSRRRLHRDDHRLQHRVRADRHAPRPSRRARARWRPARRRTSTRRAPPTPRGPGWPSTRPTRPTAACPPRPSSNTYDLAGLLDPVRRQQRLPGQRQLRPARPGPVHHLRPVRHPARPGLHLRPGHQPAASVHHQPADPVRRPPTPPATPTTRPATSPRSRMRRTPAAPRPSASPTTTWTSSPPPGPTPAAPRPLPRPRSAASAAAPTPARGGEHRRAGAVLGDLHLRPARRPDLADHLQHRRCRPARTPPRTRRPRRSSTRAGT